MPNHFHLLVRIKSETELEKLIQIQPQKTADEKGLHAPQHIFSKQFSKIFNSYSQAFNKENNRHGALIESPFKRKKISTEDYLIKCIIYIHQNPNSEDFRNYSFSSYKSHLSESKTMLNRDAVISLFEDRENFILCHQKQIDYEF